MKSTNYIKSINKDFTSARVFEAGEYMGHLVIEVPDEPKVQAAEGILVLKR